MTDPTRRMGPRKGLPPGRHHQVWLTDSEAELAALAAAVRLYRETGEIRKGSLSREVGIRVAPGLVADATAWVTDESLPLSLRERAQVLTRPPPQE